MKKEKIGYTTERRHYRLSSKNYVRIFELMESFFGAFYKERKLLKNPRKILVVRIDHIGDMILTSSLINNLKKNFPDSEITVLCRNLTKPIAEMIAGVDKIITLNPSWTSREYSKEKSNVENFLKENNEKFDLVFEPKSDPRLIKMSRKIGKFVVGYGIRGLGFMLDKEVRWEEGIKHISQRNLDLLRSLNLKIYDEKLKLEFDKNSHEKMRNKLRELDLLKEKKTFVQFSAGALSKEWPINHWKNLVKREINSGKIVISSDLDEKKIEEVRSSLDDKQKKKFFHFKTNLKEYISLLSFSERVYAVDTFAVHAASALNIPATVFFSGTNLKEEWAPLSKNSISLQDTSCPLYPCGLEKCAYNYPSPCMEKIQLSQDF